MRPSTTRRCGPVPLLACLVLALIGPAPGAAQSAPVPDVWEAVLARHSATLAADVAADGAGALTAAVFVGPVTVWARGYGWADEEHGVPAGVETIYRVGSISKSLTAMVLARMAEAGQVDLDASVASVLPELAGLDGAAAGVAAISFRQLAAHTAGLAREPALAGAATGPYAGWEEKVLAAIPTTRLTRPPGAAYAYSNIGYGILGLALGRVAGRPFPELAAELVLRPLAMTDATFVLQPAQLPRLALGNANRSDGAADRATPAREHAGRGYKVPNGGLYATVGDLARFAAGLGDRAPAGAPGPAMRSEVLAVQTPEAPNQGYGLGFALRTRPDGRLIAGHSGSVAGYTSQLLFEPGSGVGVVLLRSYNRGSTDLGAAANALLGELLSTLPSGH